MTLGHLIAGIGLAAIAFRPRSYVIVVDTFESSAPQPVLTHEFRGKDAREAEAIRQAHLKYDSFFAGCERGRFTTQGGGSFSCRNAERSRGWK